MEISVLIPSHHNSPLLQKCINSVVEAASKEPSADVDIIVIAHNQSYNDINSSLPIHIYHVEDPEFYEPIGLYSLNGGIESCFKQNCQGCVNYIWALQATENGCR